MNVSAMLPTVTPTVTSSNVHQSYVWSQQEVQEPTGLTLTAVYSNTNAACTASFIVTPSGTCNWVVAVAYSAHSLRTMYTGCFSWGCLCSIRGASKQSIETPEVSTIQIAQSDWHLHAYRNCGKIQQLSSQQQQHLSRNNLWSWNPMRWASRFMACKRSDWHRESQVVGKL